MSVSQFPKDIWMTGGSKNGCIFKRTGEQIVGGGVDRPMGAHRTYAWTGVCMDV